MIDIIIESKYVSPWREEMICMSEALVLIVAKSDFASCELVHGIMAWSIDDQLQLDDGGEKYVNE
ncbi:MAG: hypothetical protein M3P08_08960 [Thermoproteota archaeon]|nr:hypothetical protein [Thermoproteota archaeon]